LIGVTYQQEHKYENGINRITASRLYRLEVSPQPFLIRSRGN